MRQLLVIALTGMSLVSTAALTGCDRTVSEKKTVDQTPNGTVTHEDKTAVDANGNTVHTKDTTVNKNGTANP